MGGSHTTLGDGALDFRVRDGNGYDSSSMATGKSAGETESNEDYSPLHEGGKLSGEALGLKI